MKKFVQVVLGLIGLLFLPFVVAGFLWAMIRDCLECGMELSESVAERLQDWYEEEV